MVIFWVPAGFAGFYRLLQFLKKFMRAIAKIVK